MKRDEDRTKEQLVNELAELRQRIAELQASETERQQMREALRHAEERYRTILEEMHDGYYETDLAGNFTFFNDSICQILGYSKAEMMGMDYRMYTPKEDAEAVYRAYNTVYRTGEPLRAFPYPIVRKDGSAGFAETSVFLMRNEDGEPVGFRGIRCDITERKQAEEALRQSEERYRTVLEEMENSYFEVDLSGHYTFFNDSLCRTFRCSREELMGASYRVYMTQKDAKAVFKAFNQVYRTGKPNKGFTYELARKDGSTGFDELSAFPLRNQEGKIIGFRGIGHDITERKQAEEALRDSEEKFRSIIEQSTDGVILTDEQGKVIVYNQAEEQITGLKSDAVLGRHFLEVMSRLVSEEQRTSESFAQLEAQVPEFYKTGQAPWFNQLYENTIQRPDGTERIVQEIAFPIKTGKGSMICSISRDITDRKQAEEVVRQSEERYRTILDDMEGGYYEVDIAGNFTFVNDALCRHLGYSRQELIGMNNRAYMDEENTKLVYKTFNEVYRSGKPAKWFSWELIRKNGERRFVEVSVYPLSNDAGEIIGFRGIFNDITQRKQAEEEKRDLEQKAQVESRLATVGLLASGVGHEINNPLTAVVGYSQLLMQEDLREDIKEQLAAINEGAQRVASIVKKLLAFARHQKPERIYASTNTTLATTLDLLAPQLKTSNIETNLQLDPNLPWTVADIGQLQQVFLNLVINAETEMRLAHGKGKLSIKTEKTDNTIRISFQDNGPGIAEDNLEKIFDPFFTTREVGEGTGLGLSICHGIITEHNGRIYAESEPGKGATFIVELPVVPEEKHPQAAKPVAEEAAKVPTARILVVDDEPVILDFVSRVLTDEGYEVETVANAKDALVKIKSERYGLILLDIKMPGMSGAELYKRIQGIARSLARRVVFITGDVLGADTIDFLARTQASYVTKPFDAKQLKKEINRILAEGA